ncbi:class I SAM-dependent methyltransferase [Paenibacillus sp. N1-5-1-14]|uniref:class I SAM-dependent methyltransferase n=1 Tax=Paenibacillus radicibacter TaxID=2972488 RepID=UPI002158D64C|nr:class I SAM-dependent methyltransferase [Paenibacillus radicibacter]MCR8644209.1 class I SAM-dependent methyltransferase [Paenibacillus radicibacter]
MQEWFERSFGRDYLLVYQHRDRQGAKEEVRKMIAWLDLHSQEHVLDLCCGMGRHSVALAQFGYKVTGVDLSDVLLEEAHRIEGANQVSWVHGDMREVPLDSGQYDAIVNLFTSFGYFEQDEENKLVLAEMSRLLRPGGKLLLDYLNPSYVKRKIVPVSHKTTGSLCIDERRWINNGFVHKEIVITETPDIKSQAARRTYTEQVKLYEMDWFKQAFEQVGLHVQAIYGDYEGMAYESERAERMIFVGTK